MGVAMLAVVSVVCPFVTMFVPPENIGD